MKIFLLLFLNIFSFSFQNIQSAFFREKYLREIYLVDSATLTKIDYGYNGNWSSPYYFYNLSVEQGDRIMFNFILLIIILMEVVAF